LQDIFDSNKNIEELKLGWESEFKHSNKSQLELFMMVRHIELSKLAHCTSLTQLSLAGCLVVSSESILSITQNCPLVSLNLSYCQCAIDTNLELISKYTSQTLKDINLRATGITDHSLFALANHCQLLERINVGCTKVTGTGVLALIQECHRLRDLDLCYCERITCKNSSDLNNFVMNIAKKLGVRMRMIGLGGFKIQDDVLLFLAKTCPNIQHLGIGGCSDITCNGLISLAQHCTSLINLNAHGLPNITYTCIQSVLGICKGLKVVDISDCNSITLEQTEEIHQNYKENGDDW